MGLPPIPHRNVRFGEYPIAEKLRFWKSIGKDRGRILVCTLMTQTFTNRETCYNYLTNMECNYNTFVIAC